MSVNCERCGIPLRVADHRNEDARLLRHAVVPKGVCANCAMTQFLKTMEPLATVIAVKGPEMLLLAPVQAQVAAVLTTGNADAAPGEIDWQAVVGNWGLPSRGCVR